MNKKTTINSFLLIIGSALTLNAQEHPGSKYSQISEKLPAPNSYRTASGAPGHQYWQQQADYIITAELNDENQSITGFETITYHNNSPDKLTYLWLQLDQNIFDKESETPKSETDEVTMKMEFNQLKQVIREKFDGGFDISDVKDASGKKLDYFINHTMMRIELPKPLDPGKSFTFSLKWFNYINDQPKLGGRSGYEFFEKDGNYLYEIAQWFPRMTVYDDVEGWQNKQFLGRGEFALPFGNYKVSITVPADHMVGSTGTLLNPSEVLTPTQTERLNKAKKSEKPLMIVTQDEAVAAEKSRTSKKKIWKFQADNVRDFAWASSRKFLWDAMGVDVNGKSILAMSYYPKEANPLWGQYSTESVAHTLKIYSKYTVDYPYPVAISVHGPVFGMEYPMISFNGARPEEDGTYSDRTKYALISVIIHEVGHNFFPMIINSDERQWTWMDEGLNTFVQFLAEKEWDRNYPSRRGSAKAIVDYMKSDPSTLVPIMTNSESILQFGNNAYAKPATALNILRETVMGRELFDYAFKEYCRRWAFKHPAPADFFRTMEDASAVDLDWFWNGWFYTTDHVDISLENVKWNTIDTKDPEKELPKSKALDEEMKTKDITFIRNMENVKQTNIERNNSLMDFYNKYDSWQVTDDSRKSYEQYYSSLNQEEKDLIAENLNFYELTFKNVGGLIMPLIIEMEYEDGTMETKKFPAEIWKQNNNVVKKLIISKKKVISFNLDPLFETADTERENNYYPRRFLPSKFQLFKNQENEKNPMQLMKKEEPK